jgi:hypothetical protein
MKTWETSLLRFMDSTYPEIGNDISTRERIAPETEAKLRQALETFNASWR